MSGVKKGDFLIFGIIFALFIVLFAVFLPRGGGKEVVVRQNNAEVYRLPLSDSRTVSLSGNVIEISGGEVKMKNADCKNQICVRHAPISRRGETVVCLPNGVTVSIE